jgi:hypothetical protein
VPSFLTAWGARPLPNPMVAKSERSARALSVRSEGSAEQYDEPTRGNQILGLPWLDERTNAREVHGHQEGVQLLFRARVAAANVLVDDGRQQLTATRTMRVWCEDRPDHSTRNCAHRDRRINTDRIFLQQRSPAAVVRGRARTGGRVPIARRVPCQQSRRGLPDGFPRFFVCIGQDSFVVGTSNAPCCVAWRS